MSAQRTVVISGGNRGIGRAVAARFTAAGERVAVLCRSGEGPEGSLTVRADVTDSESVDRAFTEVEAQLGTPTIVVANAGVTRDTLLMRMSDEDFGLVVDTNLGGAFRLARRACLGMIKARYGRVVFISSIVGMLGSPGQINYAASKSALIGFARSMTRELGGRGITANVVAPGFIETEMTAQLPEGQRKDYAAQIPVGRTGTPEDVASAVLWLAGEAAGYVSGAVIPVDGGLGMGH